ncbi:Abi family protein [Neptuniibacter sp. CAU 1671]|uniref:Abi family protein n=1 Tax=Neptuniibacter sp. CAU 1671 TaxID=3032593 RepID=UPI0023DB1362|nr:Abi family protein [Neptuniibacter sp. CAU 1671]MDF2182572.1 Abi family protein [Neptuniibacter sp. CAU 1671]
MKFEKPAKTFDEQLDILLTRGMIIPDRSQALALLSHLNYYRLEAYWLPFEASRSPHHFKPETRFETIVDHYLFDRELRLLVLDAIERIEVSFRTQWAYHISHAYGPHGYLINSKGMRKSEHRLLNDIKDLEQHVQRSDEVFIQHYNDHYDEALPPAWVSCEVMSLGLLSRFYSNLRAYPVRRAIASIYGFDEGFLEGFMEHLCYIRNVCAHHNRLWNRHLTKKMPLPKGKPAGLKDNIYVDDANKTEHKIYNTLVVIQHLMTIICPDSSWAMRLNALIEKYPVDTKRMGFPVDWRDLPLWQQALAEPTNNTNS